MDSATLMNDFSSVPDQSIPWYNCQQFHPQYNLPWTATTQPDYEYYQTRYYYKTEEPSQPPSKRMRLQEASDFQYNYHSGLHSDNVYL